MPHLPRRTRSRWFAVAMAVTVAVTGVAPAASSANPYYVTAYANGTHRLRPALELRVSPPLPAGASLQGTARCNRVHDAQTGHVLDFGSGLPAGVFQFVSSSCFSSTDDPLRLEGTTGTIRLVGGTVVIDKAATATAGVALADLDPDNPSVLFTARVIDRVGDGVTLRGETITFGFQRGDGLWELSACSAVTDGTIFNASAECEITGDTARSFAAGTGEWEARFAETRNHHGSSARGRVLGTATDPAAAANNLSNSIKTGEVTIVPTYVEPKCHGYHDDTSVSLIGVSIGQLDCKQLQVLQILSEVGLTVATLGAPGIQTVFNAASKQITLKAAAKLAAKRVAVSVST